MVGRIFGLPIEMRWALTVRDFSYQRLEPRRFGFSVSSRQHSRAKSERAPCHYASFILSGEYSLAFSIDFV